MLSLLLKVSLTLFTLLIAYFKWKHRYWQRRKVPFIPPSIPFGSLTSPLARKEHFGLELKTVYDRYKTQGLKQVGLFSFTRPNLLLLDLDRLKDVLTRDFQYFTDRGVYYNEKSDPLSAHLFSVGGQRWHDMRKRLTPTFTISKVKAMFGILGECETMLRGNLVNKVDVDAAGGVDIKAVLDGFTIDVIGACAFGLDLSRQDGDEETPFRHYGKKVFEATKMRILNRTLVIAFPHLAKLLDVKLIPSDISDFFLGVVKETVTQRLDNEALRRNDFLQMLIDEELTIEEIAAQCFVFFLAGFETSSTTMTFALYELALNPDIQERARQEIYDVLGDNHDRINYDAINDLKYLDQIIDETLRKYPPVPLVSRNCTKDYKITDDDLTIEKGIRVIVPIYAIHHDSALYPEPERFDPDRFSDENRKTRHQYAHIPFGEGPRICIGSRFGLVQTKMGLISILRDYKLTVDSRTDSPLKMRVQSLILAPAGAIWLRLDKIQSH